MKHLFLSAAAMALLAACGGSDNGDVADDIAGAGEAAVKSAENAIEDLGKITLREGDASEASDALAAMSLDTSGSGYLNFADSNMDGAGASFDDLTFSIPDEDTSFTIANMSFDGLDMTEAGASFAKLSLSDITIAPGEDEAAQGEITIGGMELINPSPALAAWVASLNGQGEPGPFPAGEDLSFDRWSVSDIDMQIAEDGDDVSFSLDSIELGGVDSSKMAVAAVSGIKLDGMADGLPFDMKLGSLKLVGANINFLDAMRDNAGDEEEMAAAVMSAMYENPMDPGYDSVVMDDLAFDAGGISFAMPSLNASVERNADGQPVKYVTQPYKMTLKADAEGGEPGSQLAGALGMVGYETLELSGAGVSNYDPDSDTVSFETGSNYIKLEDGFEMRFGGEVEGYSAYAKSFAGMDFAEMFEGGEPDEQMMQEAVSALKLHGFTLQLTDDSMVDRLFNLAAAQSGEDPQQLRTQVIAMTSMAPMMAADSGIDMDIVNDTVTAIQGFMKEPGTLTLSLKPEQALSMESIAAMEDPSQLTKSFLGFSATHEN